MPPKKKTPREIFDEIFDDKKFAAIWRAAVEKIMEEYDLTDENLTEDEKKHHAKRVKAAFRIMKQVADLHGYTGSGIPKAKSQERSRKRKERQEELV
jgi:hypothetical protein